MTHYEFNLFKYRLLEKCHRTLKEKTPKYVDGAANNNRLRHFEGLGDRLHLSPLKIALVLLEKHLSTINNLCAEGELTLVTEDGDKVGLVDNHTILEESIIDAINYLIFIGALSHKLVYKTVLMDEDEDKNEGEDNEETDPSNK